MKLWAFAPVVALAVAGGCSKKDPLAWQNEARARFEPVLTRHRDDARARLDQLQALARTAIDAPAVDGVDGAAPAGLELAELTGNGAGKVLLINAEKAADQQAGVAAIDVAPASKVSLVRRFADSGWQDAGETPESLEAKFAQLAGFTHALVVRVKVDAKPAAVTEGGELRFTPGRASGDAQLFDWAGKRVGGFAFEVEQGESATADLASSSTLAADLESGFRADVRGELRRRFAAYVAGKLDGGFRSAGEEMVARIERDLSVALGMENLAAGVRDVAVGSDGGRTLVKIIADDPARLTDAAGAVRGEVVDTIKVVLGVDEVAVEVIAGAARADE